MKILQQCQEGGGPTVPVSQDYIDEIDLEMLRKKQRLDMQNYKQPIPKWMNLAWDAFRIVDNHSKSMIFQMPEDPKHEEHKDYIRAVVKPLSLESIRVSSMSSNLVQNKLNQKCYQTFDDFVRDMQTLFNNFTVFRGKCKFAYLSLIAI